MIRTATSTTLLLATLALTGCETPPTRDPAYAATMPPAYPEPDQRATGAIYQRGYDIVLFEDVKARRVGDIITIRLTESTNATKSAETTSERKQATSVTNPTLLGTTPLLAVPGALPLTATDNLTLESSLDSSHSFDGKGDSKQSNSLTGDLTVTVAQVLPNGNLLVRGEKRINLNQGNEYVQVQGIVRPSDIAADNSVPSTRVADATIVYRGEGQIADANKIGWLARFFISALFPF